MTIELGDQQRVLYLNSLDTDAIQQEKQNGTIPNKGLK